MRNKMLLVVTVIAMTALLGLPARADQITLGDSCASSSLSVSGTSNPILTGSASGCLATWEHSGISSTVSPWSLTGGTAFAIGSGANSLAGSINWIEAVVLGPVTGLMGSLQVTGAAGFNNEYTQGYSYPIDLTLRGGRPSDGEIPVPEPGTLTLMGSGLIAAAGFLRRRLLRS